MARRFLLASDETVWATAPDLMRDTANPPMRQTISFNPTLATAVCSIILCFFLLGFVAGVFKRYILRPGESADIPENEQTSPPHTMNGSTKPLDAGLDPGVVSALPLVKFAEFVENGKFAEDCAVCLAVFEESDRLRLLPQCQHVFHSECIDEWFKSHTTCPLCRDSLKNVETEEALAEDEDAEGDGGERRATVFEGVEVVIEGASNAGSSGAADASVVIQDTKLRISSIC